MGFRVSYVMFDGTPEIMMKSLGFLQTGVEDEMPDQTDWSAGLKDGWSVLWSEDEGYVFRAAKDIALLSEKGNVISCQVNETVMCTQAIAYSAGREIWNILWSGFDGFKPENLRITGDLPDSVPGRIETARQANAADRTVDYMFDIPVNSASEIGGFWYDMGLKPETVDKFRLLEKKPKTLFGRMFGGKS